MVIVIRSDINLYSALLCETINSFYLDHNTRYDDNDVIRLLFSQEFSNITDWYFLPNMIFTLVGFTSSYSTVLSKVCNLCFKTMQKPWLRNCQVTFLLRLCGLTFRQVNETDSCLPAILLLSVVAVALQLHFQVSTPEVYLVPLWRI